MEIAYIVVFLGLLIFLSHFFNSIFEKTKIPNAFFLLLIGILVGPLTLVIKPEDFGQLGSVFTTITLIVILFESGLSLKFADLGKAIGTATLLTTLNFILAMGVMSVLFFYLTDLQYMEGIKGWIAAFFLGAILGGTSSAVVIPMIRQLRIGEKGQAVLVLESALSDVLCLVVGLALLDSMKAWQVDITPLVNKIWQSFLFAIVIGIYAGMFWILMQQKMPKLKASMFSTFAFAFVAYGLTELAGFNGGIATLAFGITLGNSAAFTGTRLLRRLYSSGEVILEVHEKHFYSEIVFILQTYFFVYIGIHIRFGHPSTYLVALIAIVLNILFRVITVKILPKRNLDKRDRKIMSIMTPKGLVPAVLASIPLYLGIEGGDIIQEVTYAVVFSSILLVSLLVMILEIGNKPASNQRLPDLGGFLVTTAEDILAEHEHSLTPEEQNDTESNAKSDKPTGENNA